MGMIEAVLFTLFVEAILVVVFGVKLFKKIDDKFTAWHTIFVDTMEDHGITLQSIDASVTAHSPILAVLQDKAKNVVSSLEASKFVQDLEASLAKGESVLKNLVSAANPPPPVTVTVVPANTQPFGLPASSFKPDPVKAA